MATRQIYIPDDKSDLFDRAARYGDSISQAVVKAVEGFVNRKEAEEQGMKEIILETGYWPGRQGESADAKKQKFMGKEIAWHKSYCGQTSSGDDRGSTLTLYLTMKGKFVAYIEEWSRWQNEPTTAKIKIYDSLSQAKAELPDGLISKAKEAIGEDSAEFLDV